MNIQDNIKSALSEPARLALKDIDSIIDIYMSRGVTVEIEVRHREFDAIQKSLKKHGYDLNTDTYRHYKLKRKVVKARRRYRKSDVEAFNFESH